MDDEMNGLLTGLQKWLNENVAEKYRKEVLKEGLKRFFSSEGRHGKVGKIMCLCETNEGLKALCKGLNMTEDQLYDLFDGEVRVNKDIVNVATTMWNLVISTETGESEDDENRTE